MPSDPLSPPQDGQLQEFTFVFAAVEGRARDVVSFVDALPDLCDGAFVECDLGASTTGEQLVCAARLKDPLPDRTQTRLDFWAWRLGGNVLYGASQARAALRACDRVQLQVRPEQLPGALRGRLGHRLRPEPARSASLLALRLRLRRPDGDGLAFDPARGTLFVPSPLQPPLQDRVALEVRSTSGELLAGVGVVTEARGAGQSGPGEAAGFVLELVDPSERLGRALEAHADAVSTSEVRRAPRYPVCALATIAERECGGAEGLRSGRVVPVAVGGRTDVSLPSIENLSQGGVFVRTRAPMRAGTKVSVELDVPRGGTARAPGTVVHSNERGMGIQFEADPETDAAIGAAIEHLTRNRRRALIVDDDVLARRMMGDALTAKGFDVYYAADGTNGLRALIDLLLELDLMVVDLHMSGLDGEELIRRVRDAGGEGELTIVVMSGELDPEVQRRLLTAGADAILGKAAGMAAIAEAAVRTLLSRERLARRQTTGRRHRLA